MSISLAADEEELRLVPIIHIMAVLSLPPDPLVSLINKEKNRQNECQQSLNFFYLLLGDVFLRLAPNSSAASGELGGEFGLLTSEELPDIEPNELLGNKVPFLGGLPIRFPVLENLAVVEELDLLGLGNPFIVAGEVKLAELPLPPEEISMFVEVSILSGFPAAGPAPDEPPLIGMILAGESFRGIGGILSSLSIVKS